MRQLSGLDAAFLYLETENAPMHIGGLSILDPSEKSGQWGLDELRAYLAARLHLAPALRERLLEVPMQLGKPYWVDDDEIDMQVHVERTRLAEPGGLRELASLVSYEHSQRLERDRPLWRILLIEGIEDSRFPPGSMALFARIHHAAIDGMSGNQILATLFEPTPVPRPIPLPKDVPVTDEPGDEPGGQAFGSFALLRRAGGNLLDIRRTLPRTLGQTLQAALRGGAAWGLKRVELPPMPFSAPRTRWNAPVGRERAWSAALLDLERIRAVKSRAEATVNDVVLATCAGALRRYLREKDELPEKPLVAMVPVSVRSDEEKGSMGNQVSAMLVSLATDVDDAAGRLAAIHTSATGSKVYHQAVGARTLVDSSDLVPFAVAGLAARLYTRLHLADRHTPIFNLVITNVPGPQVPLYLDGVRLHAHLGTGPILDGMGLILPIFSYNGTLSIGVTSCRDMMDDVERFAEYLEASFEEIEDAT